MSYSKFKEHSKLFYLNFLSLFKVLFQSEIFIFTFRQNRVKKLINACKSEQKHTRKSSFSAAVKTLAWFYGIYAYSLDRLDKVSVNIIIKKRVYNFKKSYFPRYLCLKRQNSYF